MNRADESGNTLEAWTRTVCRELGITEAVPTRQVLDLARDVAHGVARPAAPLTAFLVGIAAGRDPAAADEAMQRVAGLARTWAE